MANHDQPIIVKKVKGHGHAHHGGSWKVAYADFVTAMMAFFMVMWIMGLSDETRAQIQGYFNDPLGFMKNHPRSTNIISSGLPKSKPGPTKKNGDEKQGVEQQAKNLARKLQDEVAREAAVGDDALKALLEGVEIEVTDEGVEIEFIERHRTFFEIGSATIRPEALPIVHSIGRLLERTHRPMVIDGHTDARPLDRPSYNNWDLSTDRAASVRRAFQSVGVGERQFLQVRGNADRRLRWPDDPYNGENRRVTVRLPSQCALPADGIAAGTSLKDAPDLSPASPAIAPR